MEHCPSWESNTCSATPEIPHHLTELGAEVHYCVHKTPPLDRIGDEMTPVQFLQRQF
jgi:hypothetical protein